MKPTQPYCPKPIVHFILIIVFSALTAASTLAAGVELRWDANTPAPDGYRVFSRKADEAYTYDRPDWEGDTNTCKLADLADQTIYCFTVRAYSGDRESADAVEVCFVPPGTDNEGDGMPDDWEHEYGLDYLLDDANADADGDGISNRDEYRSGLEPDYEGEGQAPNSPIPTRPEFDAEVDLNPMLAAADFSDPEGDAHIATQWQLFDTLTDACLMDVVTDHRLLRLQVPLLLLTGGSTYRWRVRFFDSGGRASGWSVESRFTTQPLDDDADGNGIPDGQEGGILQVDVDRSASVMPGAADLAAIVVASSETVSAIERMVLVEPADLETDETTPARLPATIVAYKLILHEPGQRALVTIHLSDPAPPESTWIRYDAISGWQEYGEFATLSADRRSVTLETRDGGWGDTDGVANGIILDAAGLQQPASDDSAGTADIEGETENGAEDADEADSSDDTAENNLQAKGSGGGGCFISSINGAQ